MKRFVLERHEDISGVSGTGIIGEGVKSEVKNHPMPVVFFWLGDKPTTGLYPNMETLVAIHGHNGSTVVHWIDGPLEDHCESCHVAYCVEHGSICPRCLRES